MTLEDFFTLSEMRDGISSLARVEELLSMIQKLNDHAINNLSDAARQWSTVASVLAATNKECLSQFVELNGLSFLKKWLQQALDSNTYENEIVVEELILSLLTAFERLPIDHKRITASEIGATIEHLLDHRSTKIMEKAKILHDRWDHAENDHARPYDQDNTGISQENQHIPAEDVQTGENGSNSGNLPVSIPPSFASGEGKDGVQSDMTESQILTGISLLEFRNNERGPICDQFHSTSLNTIVSNTVLAGENSSASSLISNSCQEKLHVIEELPVCNVEGKLSAETCAQFCLKGDADDQCDASGSKDILSDVKDIDIDAKEVKPSKSIQESGIHSLPLVFHESKVTSAVATEPVISCMPVSYIGDSSSRVMEHQPVAGAVDHGLDKDLMTTKESMPAANLTSFQDPSCKASIHDNISDPQLSDQKEEATSSVIKDLDCELNFKYCKSHFSASTDFLKAVPTAKANEEINQKSGLELECLDDALEVARQVAIAVEKEVVDYRETFCSSPNDNPREAYGSHSPDSKEEKQEELTEQVGRNRLSDGAEYSDPSSPDKGSEITQNISSDQENIDQNLMSPEPKVSAQASVCKADLDGCTFDLNANICNDEPECSTKVSPKMPINVSAPVAVIASSKGAPGVPATLCFGGEMGWKGSAATSAFRPASPRRTDGERISCAKQKLNFLEIDLNVAERVDGTTDEPASVKQVPSSFGSKTEKQNLDLNCLGDEEVSILPFSSWKLNIRNGERSQSSASSSYHKQSSFRDFDLNDNPSVNDAGSHSFRQSSNKALESFGWKAPHEPIVKIMGAEIPITRTSNMDQGQLLSIPNGLPMEPGMVTRPLLPCTSMPPLAYGFSGLPSGSSMSVPAAYYSPRSIPYIAETRGMVPVTHVSGSSSGSGHTGTSSRPPHFLFSASSMPYMSGYGNALPGGLSLNNGIAPPEGGIRGSIFEHQFFLQGHRGWMEEQTQPSTSVTPLKRKEPDSGWEPLPPLNGCKRMASRP
ncbi:uncharacterized protein LOC122023409 isoform X1 [Zingiber officinale]|uniref:TFIIS N-terminal domain-containing protein n=1 Tax=Zingiber officinale TaxID=94328 RepID=A0A8J5EXZ5_ZINOF|nr:uncharacterized protein LOC122023409 isoform X1 [Zingiber officinale]KAG6475701.1 hypothetical protein ZIOFF_064930 [Zingiber officinale]